MAYVMRTCGAGGVSYGGFVWPLEVGAVVEAPDWDPSPRCGNGLHGFLNGEGDGALADFSDEVVWMILEVEDCDITDLGGKVKFPRCVVNYVGNRSGVTERMINLCPGSAVICASVTVGYRGTAMAGDCGTATAGDGGTATAGYCGTAMAGDCGTATAGDRGTATAGDGGTATAGDGGTATAGDCGTATAGDGGTATVGYCGTATAGDRGTATAGDGGIISIRWFDGARYRVAVGYVGENGIGPNITYRVEGGKFVRT